MRGALVCDTDTDIIGLLYRRVVAHQERRPISLARAELSRRGVEHRHRLVAGGLPISIISIMCIPG